VKISVHDGAGTKGVVMSPRLKPLMAVGSRVGVGRVDIAMVLFSCPPSSQLDGDESEGYV
jgi:hypothetical protein